MYVAETITSEVGDLRARVILDEHSYDMKPDGCHFGTVYRLESSYWNSSTDILGQDSCVRSDLSDTITSLWLFEKDMELMEAVLRGQANVCDDCGEALKPYSDEAGVYTWTSEAGVVCPEWEDEDDSDWHKPRYEVDEQVVGFDYIERDYGKMINVVTLDDLKHWGFESVEDYRTTTGNDDPSHGNLDEWRAWADGDVYYVDVESKVIERIEIKELDGTVIRVIEHESWEDAEGTCHGFYGEESAVEYAREQVAAWVGN